MKIDCKTVLLSLSFFDVYNLLFVDCIHQWFLVSFSYNYDKHQYKSSCLNKTILHVTVKIHSGDDKVFSLSLPYRVNFHSATQTWAAWF